MNSKITALLEQMKGNKARPLQRDSDTLAKWDNHGVLFFLMFHEWNDSYDATTGETGTITGETYDSVTDTFSVATTAGVPVFNGRLSGLWDLISQCLPSELESMYGKMRASGFNAEKMWELYQSFKGQWCEALYNADAMGYANTGRFDMAYGDKSEAMRAFFRQRFRYLDSKYGQNTGSAVVMRLWGNGQGVAIRHYCPIYASMNWGAGAVQRVRSIKPGEPAYFENPGVTFNDTTVTIYDADLVTEISSYATLPDGTRQESGLQKLGSSLMFSQGLGNCKRLKSLVLDYSGGEANTQATNSTLDAAGSVALRRMVIRNCPNVTGHPVFVSQVLEEVDLRGTAVTGVTVPETDTLTALRLPDTVMAVDVAHLGGLSELTMEGVGALASLRVIDCPQLDIRPLLYEALTSGALQSVTLEGVNWASFPVKYLKALASLENCRLTGSINLASTDNMSFALKQKCVAKWGNIDSADNSLHIGYTQRPVEIIRISGAGYYSEPGDYQLQVISDDPLANDFTKIEWSMTANSYAEIDTLAGRVHVARVGTEETAPTAEVTVTVTKADGSTVTKTATVGFYKRPVELGDYLFADGTYGNKWDDTKTAVAQVWLISKEHGKAMAVALRNAGQYAYGNDSSYIVLTDSPNFDTATIAGIPVVNTFLNQTPSGLTSLLRDGTAPDGWKQSGVKSSLRYGFMTLTEAIGEFEEGDVIPVGMYETLCAIRHRNKILSDSGIQLVIPSKSQGETEMASFKRLLNEANTTPGNGYRYYFPLFSAAYAYEPPIGASENLHPMFAAHKWFVPAPGDMLRLMWLVLSATGENKIFADAISMHRFDGIPNSYGDWWGSTGQYSATGRVAFRFNNNGIDNTSDNTGGAQSKASNGILRPMIMIDL